MSRGGGAPRRSPRNRARSRSPSVSDGGRDGRVVRSVDDPAAVGMSLRSVAVLLDAVVEPAVGVAVVDIGRAVVAGRVAVVDLEASAVRVAARPQATQASW